MSIEKIKMNIRNIPDFPKPGIQYKDITTLFKKPEIFKEVINRFYKQLKNKKIDKIIGIESRGFIFAAPLALKLGCQFILARKPGKLPSNTTSVKYDLEYGKDSIEMHTSDINDNDNIVIVDDLIATGGTAKAVGEIVKKLNGKIIEYNFLIALKDLKGKDILYPEKVFSIIEY